MYQALTRNIEVTVTPQYLPERSSPENNEYFWAYTIEIINRGAETVQLRTRHWRITDAFGRRQEVKGAGVVGKQPVLKLGKSFEYTSGVPLPTPSGFMTGSYGMSSVDGEAFEIAIPTFRSTVRTRGGRSIDLWIGDVRRFENVGRTAEFAGHRNLAVFDHLVAVRLRERAQHRFHALARTGTLRMQFGATKYPHAPFVEQPVEQTFGRHRRIDQLDVFHGLDQRAAFNPGIVFADGVAYGALGRVAWIEVCDARTFRRTRHELKQHAAGAPAVRRAARRGQIFLGHREAHAGRNLLGAHEIFVCGIFERPAFQRDQALVAALGAA